MTHPTLERLEDQIAWYDQRSNYCQRMYKSLKLLEVGSAALIPFLTAMLAPAWAAGGLGILIVILEGVQHLNQYQQNWITYCSTRESLKHEKYLYLAKAGPYAQVTDVHALLADRIESLISREHAKWISTQEKVVEVHKSS